MVESPRRGGRLTLEEKILTLEELAMELLEMPARPWSSLFVWRAMSLFGSAPRRRGSLVEEDSTQRGVRTMIGEYFGIFFCRSSESSSGGSSFVALVGNRLLFSPRHVTGVNPAAKAAVSTSARSTVARIIAVPPTWNLSYLEPVVGGFRKANPDGSRRRRSPSSPWSIARSEGVDPPPPHTALNSMEDHLEFFWSDYGLG